MARATSPRPESTVFASGLLKSLDDLAVRCALVATGVPVAVFLVALARGHRFLAGEASDLGQPALAAGMASYVVIPMLALTSAACAATVAVAAGWTGRAGGAQAVRIAFLVAASVLALLLTVVYDGYLLPDLLG